LKSIAWHLQKIDLIAGHSEGIGIMNQAARGWNNQIGGNKLNICARGWFFKYKGHDIFSPVVLNWGYPPVVDVDIVDQSE
jgi:hypothetical protein